MNSSFWSWPLVITGVSAFIAGLYWEGGAPLLAVVALAASGVAAYFGLCTELDGSDDRD